ncbi:MAG TPA: acyltransferase [Bryobacteraceae bacterium]|nr:acyltransferase [Bryobacteraceae bacterium]
MAGCYNRLIAPEPRSVLAASRKPAAAHLAALTGLRFLLALWVILFHLTAPGDMLGAAAQRLPAALYGVIRGGYLAVTTFFVLSGFVLSRSYAATRWTGKSLLRYGVGRFARVYPVYLLSLAVVSPFILWDSTPRKVSLVAAYGFLLQGWMGNLPVGWNTPAWSLSCEIFFYLLFPLAAVCLQRANWLATLAAAAGACCLTRWLWALGVSDGIKPLIHFSDFLMGIAASRAYDLLLESRRRPHGAWFYVPAGILGAALIAFPGVLPAHVDLNSALRPLNALLLIGFALGGGPAGRALSSPLAVYLGKSSYAMYILHVPILWWLPRWHLPWSGEVSAAAYVSLVIAASAWVYCFVEEPANRYLRSRLDTALQS